jgi:hypothetical protein
MPTYRKNIQTGDIVAVCPPSGKPFLVTVTAYGKNVFNGFDFSSRFARYSLQVFDVVPVLGSARCAKCNRRLPKVTHNKRFCAACYPLRRTELATKASKLAAIVRKSESLTTKGKTQCPNQ